MIPSVLIDAALSVDIAQAGTFAAVIAASGQQRRVEDLTLIGDAMLEDLRSDEGRVQLVEAASGTVRLAYRAEVDIPTPAPASLTTIERLRFLRPSRYCPSDRVAGLAAAQFGTLDPRSAAFAVESWINYTVAYTPGATDASDDALHPLLTRSGVCRDFAHLGVMLCRALGIPARYTAVYAPGLSPMDFHAVFEAAIDGSWYVFDGTRLAPRSSLVRIGTGRDAADAALLTPLTAQVAGMSQELTVTTVGALPSDDHTELVALA